MIGATENTKITISEYGGQRNRLQCKSIWRR
jgi:hypothetical protein